VAQFLSAEWVAAFNEALEGLEPDATVVGGSIAAARGSFSVEQLVLDAPGDRTLRVRLGLEGGRLSMSLPDEDPRAEGQGPANVVISLSYADAAAVSRGDLDAARALGEGRVRIKGDLAMLTALQGILASAGARLADLRAGTTYGADPSPKSARM
jgi:hypothetical protein